jgi:hypothetical protein
MSNQQPIHTARRKARQRERERRGIAVPPCVLCIEDHHTAGRRHDPILKAPLCQKHHREIHEQLLQAGTSLKFKRNRNKRVAMALRAAAVYDRAKADAMERWANSLDESRGEDA